MDGWIKMHRKFLKWEWYKDIPCKVLALHYLLSANYEEKTWRGRPLKKGQLITGLYSLSEEIGLSTQQIRTANKKLSDCGFCNIESTNKYSIVTICNYAVYQSEGKPQQQRDNKPPTSHQQTDQHTNNNNIRNKEERKEEYIIPPKPPKGGEKPKWKTNYEVYLDGLRAECMKAFSDASWMNQQQSFNPGIDIRKSIEKACVNFWATDAGWKRKKRARTTDIDWRSTFANALSQRTNRVYLNDFFTKQTEKYEQKRTDSEQRKRDSMLAIQRCDEEAEQRKKELEATGTI